MITGIPVVGSSVREVIGSPGIILGSAKLIEMATKMIRIYAVIFVRWCIVIILKK